MPTFSVPFVLIERVESAKQRLQEQHAMLGLNRDSSVYERGEAMGNPNLRRWTTTKGHVRVLARTLTDEALSGGLPVLPRE